ncbi:MAG: adenylate/guanylate cyclase domain-containing protein [Ignavibacteriae bacterium]|nr:adenylate/guanylate cyclase domain-containing protein [Ignavibacteriota bacterium]
MSKNQFHKIIFLICYWLAAVIFYVFLEMAIENYTATVYGNYKLNYNYNFTRVLIIAILAVVVGGTALASFEVLFFSKLFRKKPLGIVLVFKTFFYSLSIFCLTSIATYISLTFILDKTIFHIDVLDRFLNYLISPKLWAVMLYWGFAVMSALFVLHVSEKLGQGVLINFLLGRYYDPKEENRIFMFLDLISSTAYAEKLGHKKYSRLIQDCYHDLTDVVLKCDAQIYQYVGDEVVFTWEKEKGLQNNNCVKAFFKFEHIIMSKKNYYEKKYGFVPVFKAGLNCGLVTVVEVGEMKKEIAYHGDAINIAARIRSSCTDFNKKLLLSAELLSLLNGLDSEFLIESIGVTQLKGKKNIVGVFSIDKMKSL